MSKHRRVDPPGNHPESIEQLVQTGAGLRNGLLGASDVRLFTGKQVLKFCDVAAQVGESGSCHLGEFADQALAFDVSCLSQPLPGRLQLASQSICSPDAIL